MSYTTLAATSPPEIGAIFVGPLAVASIAPFSASQRSRYTASEASPMRKYGRSVPAVICGGNCSEIASGNVALPSPFVVFEGSSHVRWNAISLSL